MQKSAMGDLPGDFPTTASVRGWLLALRGVHAFEQDIFDGAREHMAACKVPRLVEFADVLPKSGSGKVMWRLLQEKETQRA